MIHAMPIPAKPAMDLNVEGLRGVAAGLVALSHLWGTGAFMAADAISPWLRHWEAGHAAVLVFFVLSGYVIGLTNPGPPAPGQPARYLKRRAVRLLPIYWLALLLTAAVTPAMSWDRWLAHVAMLQNDNPYFGWLPAPPAYNTPLWSLHYEVVYYLAFLVLWRQPNWWGSSILGALVVSLAGLFFPGLPFVAVGLATGWIFWTAGWWLSRQPVATAATARVPMLAGVFLLLAGQHLVPGRLLAGFFHLPGATHYAMVNAMNLALLPACLVLVGGAARRDYPGARACLALTALIPLAATLVLLGLGRLGELSFWRAGAGFVALGLVTLPWRRNGWLQKWAPFGRISYAFYLVHMPLIFLLAALGLHAASLPGLLACGALWLALAALVAAVLELWLQPRIRNACLGRSSR